MKALQTVPKEVRFDKERLFIDWKDGHHSNWSLLNLRKSCPCAVCRGGDFGEIGAMTGKITQASIASFNYVGRYAINIIWGDTHATGIHSYKNLRSSCECESCGKLAAEKKG